MSKTIIESPRRKLERELGITRSSPSLRINDWVPFSCGDKVHRKDDPRHVGRVEALHNHSAKIKWDDNGWYSHEGFDDIEKA